VALAHETRDLRKRTDASEIGPRQISRMAVIMRTPLDWFNLPAAPMSFIFKVLWYLCRGNVSWKASDD
jgi:hypothetical protein